MSTTATDTALFIDQGQGAPLLLLHGSLCDYRYWQAQLPLSAHCRLIAPSLPGYWPWPQRQGEFSAQGHAHYIQQWLQQQRLGAVHVLGHSRGASVALALAQQFPEHVASLILADAGVRTMAQLQAGLDSKRAAQAAIAQGEVDAGLRIFIDAVSGSGTFDKMVRSFKAMLRDNAHTLAWQQYEPPYYLDSTTLAPLARLPITLIGGAQSPAPFPAIQATLATLWPQAVVHTLSPASHGMNLALPHAFNRCVLMHLTRCGALPYTLSDLSDDSTAVVK